MSRPSADLLELHFCSGTAAAVPPSGAECGATLESRDQRRPAVIKEFTHKMA